MKTQGLSPEEIQALEDDIGEDGNPSEEEQTGQDDESDDSGSDGGADNGLGVASRDDVPNDKGSAKQGDQTPTKSDEDQPAAAAPQIDDDGEPIVLPVEPKDFKAEYEALDAKTSDVEAKWAAGELDDEARVAALRDIKAAERELIKAETRQEAKLESNQQAVMVAQQRFLGKLMEASKAAGQIDYSKPAAQAAFNSTLLALQSTDEFKSVENFDKVKALYRKAHVEVMAAFGIKGAPAKDVQKTVQRQVDFSNLPPTLGRAPQAADASIEADRFAHLKTLQGVDLERAVAKMSDAEQAEWLSS